MKVDREGAKNLLMEVILLYGGESVETFLDDVESILDELVGKDAPADTKIRPTKREPDRNYESEKIVVLRSPFLRVTQTVGRMPEGEKMVRIMSDEEREKWDRNISTRFERITNILERYISTTNWDSMERAMALDDVRNLQVYIYDLLGKYINELEKRPTQRPLDGAKAPRKSKRSASTPRK